MRRSEVPMESEVVGQSQPSKAERIGLIAGNGRFPIIFARNVASLGYTVSAVAHVGETSPELEQYVNKIHWVQIGEFNKLINALKTDGVRQAVMLGGIKKTHLFSGALPDFRALAIASRLKHWKDDAILRAVAAELETEGIRIRESTFGLDDIIVREGSLTKRSPNKGEWEDIRYGWQVAGEIGKLEIGQCVLVKDKVVVAVEAVEGTDDAIRRGGGLASKGVVVVKRSKPHQDLRFDLPAIGPGTIETMKAVNGSALALEADRSVILDREETIQVANQAGISVVGLSKVEAEP